MISKTNKPLSEYPRPQFMRESYVCLNGAWDYKISEKPVIPSSFDGKILVPYSPETELSGINHLLKPNEYLFYKLEFELEENFVKDLVYLSKKKGLRLYVSLKDMKYMIIMRIAV